MIDRDKFATGSKWFADGLNWIGDVASDVTNWLSENFTVEGAQNKSNREFVDAQNAINREREDTAFTRAAADMENAGLSKTLAAGTPSPTSAMSAPQDMNSVNSSIDNILAAVGLQDTLANNAKNREKTDAEIGLINAQTDNTNTQASLNKMDADYYARNNLSPAQNNKYVQFVTSVWDMLSNWWEKTHPQVPWVESDEPRSAPYTANSGSRGKSREEKPYLNMADAQNLMPALASPSYDTEFRDSYPIEKRMVARDEATYASYDRGMADNDTLELNWMAIGPAVMDAMMDLPDSFTEHLHYDEDSCHMYLDNGNYEKLAPKMFADLRDNLMIANGWNEPVAETMIKYALIYGVKNRMW